MKSGKEKKRADAKDGKLLGFALSMRVRYDAPHEKQPFSVRPLVFGDEFYDRVGDGRDRPPFPPRNGVFEGKYQNAFGHALALSVTRRW